MAEIFARADASSICRLKGQLDASRADLLSAKDWSWSSRRRRRCCDWLRLNNGPEFESRSAPRLSRIIIPGTAPGSSAPGRIPRHLEERRSLKKASMCLMKASRVISGEYGTPNVSAWTNASQRTVSGWFGDQATRWLSGLVQMRDAPSTQWQQPSLQGPVKVRGRHLGHFGGSTTGTNPLVLVED